MNALSPACALCGITKLDISNFRCSLWTLQWHNHVSYQRNTFKCIFNLNSHAARGSPPVAHWLPLSVCVVSFKRAKENESSLFWCAITSGTHICSAHTPSIHRVAPHTLWWSHGCVDSDTEGYWSEKLSHHHSHDQFPFVYQYININFTWNIINCTSLTVGLQTNNAI